jgi:hypothetical protein
MSSYSPSFASFPGLRRLVTGLAHVLGALFGREDDVPPTLRTGCAPAARPRVARSSKDTAPFALSAERG